MSYAGDITPAQAWKMLADNPDAVLVDVRSDAEWHSVGVPDLSGLGREAVFLQWNTSDGRHNDNFVSELLAQVPASETDRPVMFLCRAGSRSIPAAAAATKAGLTPAYNIVGGFEGSPAGAGWVSVGLPARQG